MAFLVYVVLSTSFMLGALYLVHQGQMKAKEEAVSQRLSSAGLRIERAVRRRDRLTMMFERAGIELDDTQRQIGMLAVAFLSLVLLYALGLRFGMLAIGFAAVVFYSVMTGLATRRRNLIVAQLPRLLDQVVRLMRTGKTIGDSFFLATEDAARPLKDVMERLKRNILLGMSIPEAFKETGETFGLRELQVMALGVGVNARFGGSLIDLLSNVIEYIQQREKMSRQLRAMTGETRFSAMVLAVLPILMGAFMFIQNPDYLMNLFDSPTGSNVLMTAGVMQLLGMLVIWKMLRSI